eukprot:GFUD01041261.1.p1 GENE.GFUD01041261.1~~GFUD01041261.1.p1  ORF type:complete len:351 (-),score=39.85 GFUD01041261.1:50-1102(-)
MMSRFIQTKVLLIFSCMENAIFSIKPIVFGWFLGVKNQPETMGMPIKTKVEELSIDSLTKCIVMKIQTVFAMDKLTAAIEKIDTFVCSFWQMAEHIPALKRRPQLILETASNTISPIVEIGMSIKTRVVGISIASLPNYILSMISAVEHVSTDEKGILAHSVELLTEKHHSLKKISGLFTETLRKTPIIYGLTTFDLVSNLSWTKLKAKVDDSYIKVTNYSSTKLKSKADGSCIDPELQTNSPSGGNEKSRESDSSSVRLIHPNTNIIADTNKVNKIELTWKLEKALLYGAILLASISYVFLRQLLMWISKTMKLVVQKLERMVPRTFELTVTLHFMTLLTVMNIVLLVD